jgi:arylsulfate sulfotransferase
VRVFFLVSACLVAASPAFPMSVVLSGSVSSPAPLGTPVTWTADVSGAEPGTLWYRFRTRYSQVGVRAHAVNFGYHTVVDYGPNASFTWSTIAREGPYEIEVSVQNKNTGETAANTSLFTLTRLAGGTPVLTATSHPLVYIYSIPACSGRWQAETISPQGVVQSTPLQPCDSHFSNNVYVSGMMANATYTVRTRMMDGDDGGVTGSALALTTSSLPIQLPRIVQTGGTTPASSDILLHAVLNTNAIATDLNGNVVWYVPFMLTLITRPVAGGAFLGIIEDGTKGPSEQIFREFDLTGATLAETNAARVSEQLTDRGMRPINSFHHEAIRLPDGRYLVMAGTEQIMNDVQGPGPVDILGDMILVLDANLQVVWAWDAFDHLDPNRQAILGETCTYPATVACSNFYLASTANDWLHGNSLQLTPDGNILYSVRHQDWVVKIDYRNGAGSGDILWRMGPDGDFQINSSSVYPWFSHQHDPNFLPDNQTLLVFDNGNTRITNGGGSGNSRAMVLRIDEQGRTAAVTTETDLGVNSAALGTAEGLTDGGSHFAAGFFTDPDAPPSRITQLYELDASGAIESILRVYAQEYRNIRMSNLYTPPTQWVP